MDVGPLSLFSCGYLRHEEILESAVSEACAHWRNLTENGAKSPPVDARPPLHEHRTSPKLGLNSWRLKNSERSVWLREQNREFFHVLGSWANFDGHSLACIRENVPKNIVNRSQLDEICLVVRKEN